MAKQPRLPPTDRPQASDQKNRGVRVWTATSSAQSQQSVVTQENADEADNSIRQDDGSGSSNPLTDSGKLLLSHAGTPANSYTQNQAVSRSRQPVFNAPAGNSGCQMPRPTPKSDALTSDPTHIRESLTSRDSVVQASGSGSKSTERNHYSSLRVGQIPTGPRSARQRVISDDGADENKRLAEESKRLARAHRFGSTTVEVAQNPREMPDREYAQLQAQQRSGGQARLQEQARMNRNSVSSRVPESGHPQRPLPSTNETTAVWPISSSQLVPAPQSSGHDAPRSNQQRTASNTSRHRGQEHHPCNQAPAQSAFFQNPSAPVWPASYYDKAESRNGPTGQHSRSNPNSNPGSTFMPDASLRDARVPSVSGLRLDQTDKNDAHVNFVLSNAVPTISMRRNGQNVGHDAGASGNGSLGMQNHVLTQDRASHVYALTDDDQTTVIYDIYEGEQPEVGTISAQDPVSLSHSFAVEDANDVDIDMDTNVEASSRSSTPLTPCTSEAGDLPATSGRASKPKKRSKGAKVADEPGKTKKGTGQKVSKEERQADRTSRNKSRSDPPRAMLVEPEQIPKSPSPPPWSPALPAEIKLGQNLNDEVLVPEGGASNVLEPIAAEASASSFLELRHSKRSAKSADLAKKVVFDGIATSNIIPNVSSEVVWSGRRLTRGATKTSTKQTENSPVFLQDVEQKSHLQSLGTATSSGLTPTLDAILGPSKGKRRRTFVDVIERQNADGTYALVAVDGVFVNEDPAEPLPNANPSVVDGNPPTSDRRSLRNRVSSRTPMREAHVMPEAPTREISILELQPVSSSSSRDRPNSNSKRKAVEVLESVTAEALQGSQMDHIVEETKPTGRRSAPISKRKPSNVHKQSAIQTASEVASSGVLAPNGELDPDILLPSTGGDFTNQSTRVRPRIALLPGNEAGSSTNSRISARRKSKAAELVTKGYLDPPLEPINQQSADVSTHDTVPEDQGGQLARNADNPVQTSSRTVGPRNDVLKGCIQRIDEALVRQEEQAAAFAEQMQNIQDSNQQKMQELILEMQETKAQQVALLKEHRLFSAQNVQAMTKLRQEMVSWVIPLPALKPRKKLVVSRPEGIVVEDPELSIRNEQASVRMPDDLTPTAIAHSVPRPKKKQVSSRQEMLASSTHETEHKRVSNKKRKVDGDGDYDEHETVYALGKGKKKKKDADEERSRLDATLGDSRPSKRPRKDCSGQDTNLVLSDVDTEQLEQDQVRKQIAETIRLSLLDQTEEVQMGDCTLARYDGYQRCRDCTVQAANGSCRFKGWRVFPLVPKTGTVKEEPWFDHQTMENEALEFPSELNREFTVQQSFRMKETVVKALLPVITKELLHCVQHGAKRKTHDIASRATCDRCSMTIFGGSWSCLCCGKEYCFECESDVPDSVPMMRADPIKEGSSEDRLMTCGQGLHSRKLLFATTTFDLSILQYHWLQMVGFAERAGIPYDKQDVKQLLPNENISEVLFPTIELEVHQPGQREERGRARATDNVTDDTLKSYLTTQSHDSYELPPEATEQLDSHDFYRIDASKLDEPIFDRMWRDGIPIVIDNAQSYLQEDWTPTGFQTLFGNEKCTVYDCQAEIGEDSTIDRFFGLFDSKPDGAEHKVLKLKDWPTNAEFKERCPSLNHDFHNTLPVPDYTRRDGVTNVSAFFPTNTNPPDIGPKLYAALRGIETEGGKGSTRMHMDIADAINVMTYASKREDGKEGCAVWHIYRKDDLDKIRAFLREKFAAVHQFVDPVHSQLFYLDSTLRQELFDKTGVFAHRIYQYPGQAVMIPAYCAHQVCNHSDCIKIACDFVSPHSITRCAQLTQEFRGENVVSDWKDDVLQLNSMMWYTWLFCSQYDSIHQHSPALSFDETTVGAFIDERSKSMPGQTGEGLAHLKPSRPTADRLKQAKTKGATESPFWATPEFRLAKSGPIPAPKRLGKLPKMPVPSTALPVDASQRPTGHSNSTTSTGPPIPQPEAPVIQDTQPSDFDQQRSGREGLYCATASSNTSRDVETMQVDEHMSDLHLVSAVADDVVLEACTTVPAVDLSLQQHIVN